MTTASKATRRAILAGLLTLPVVPTLFWLSAYNFNQRGETAVICALLTVVTGAIAAVSALTYPTDIP